ISVAMAMTLAQHDIGFDDVDSHSTLTSLYGILAMARVHNQNPRTYAEIMATSGDSAKIVESFISNLTRVSRLAAQRSITQLEGIIQENRDQIPAEFIRTKMNQAQAVDAVLSDIGFKGE
ncbi:MAG: prephenate dehydrogenase/arogenate dehydrogenase family protein, partial [Desulfofustis sp.]|nr:prephenate dehydrogenase/arogenate dehydrogenase family protein [Desulfofustis sp.]